MPLTAHQDVCPRVDSQTFARPEGHCKNLPRRRFNDSSKRRTFSRAFDQTESASSNNTAGSRIQEGTSVKQVELLQWKEQLVQFCNTLLKSSAETKDLFH